MNQEGRILEYMKQHGGITAAEAFQHCGVSRLSARIFDLKQCGIKIEKETVKGVNRFGEKVRYDRYKVVE